MATINISKDEQKRIDAMNAYLDGEKPSDMRKRLGRSYVWFYKWRKRFRSKKDEWYKEESKKPIVIANKTKQERLKQRL